MLSPRDASTVGGVGGKSRKTQKRVDKKHCYHRQSQCTQNNRCKKSVNLKAAFPKLLINTDDKANVNKEETSEAILGSFDNCGCTPFVNKSSRSSKSGKPGKSGRSGSGNPLM